MGYHYPRSPETATAAATAFHEFAARFPASVVTDYRHHYLVAANGSRTDAADYLGFCQRQGLPYMLCAPPLVRTDTVNLCLRVPEAIVDMGRLCAQLYTELTRARVLVRTRTPVDIGKAGWLTHDRVVNCTYGKQTRRMLRYEVCETALVRLGDHFAGRSFVVMDGPFCSLDPVPGQDHHMLYDVVHSVHDEADGFVPGSPLMNLVDKGRIYTDETNVGLMEQTLRRFVRGIGMPEYRGSLFSVRAVLPNVEATDARPTLVDVEDNGRVISILSGKIGNAVGAARRVVEQVTGAPVPA
jgi:hypothetical protein